MIKQLNRLQQIIYLCIMALLLSGCSGSHVEPITPSPTNPPEYWPTEEWRHSTPAEQGLDTKHLDELQQYIANNLSSIQSTLIVRRGYLVFEYYRYSYGKDTTYCVYSITKSFISALIGIALQEGYLNNLDQKMVEFFPEYATAETATETREVTVRNLLTMTGGFDCPNDSCNWKSIPITFKRPFLHEPGIQFNYDSDAVHVLSGIITKATGMSALEFAKIHLFKPLAFSEVLWPSDLQGNNHGGTGLRVRPTDMAKFGYLYLKDGLWDGKQIIPSDYVKQSTQKQNEGGFPENESYGYLWWVTTVGGYSAYFAGGYGGQYIYVIPDLDIVVAITSGNDRSHVENRDIIGEFVVPAVLK